MSNTSVTSNQPKSLNSMDLYRDFHVLAEEKSLSNLPPYPYAQEHSYQQQQQLDDACESHTGPCHKRCHSARLRRFLLPILVALLSLGAVLALSCFFDMSGLFSEGAGGLLKRQSTTTTNGQSTFVDHKLYLIIVFVGLFVVLILAICLSAWCCKGSFQNPLCCPCYLCACCGGLACLECIGCGLCAEGVEQM